MMISAFLLSSFRLVQCIVKMRRRHAAATPQSTAAIQPPPRRARFPWTHFLCTKKKAGLKIVWPLFEWWHDDLFLENWDLNRAKKSAPFLGHCSRAKLYLRPFKYFIGKETYFTERTLCTRGQLNNWGLKTETDTIYLDIKTYELSLTKSFHCPDFPKRPNTPANSFWKYHCSILCALIL